MENQSMEKLGQDITITDEKLKLKAKIIWKLVKGKTSNE